jgi:hypothetical protein
MHGLLFVYLNAVKDIVKGIPKASAALLPRLFNLGLH